MSLTHIRTLLPLAEYARIMAIPGWIFCQLDHPERIKRGCDDPVLQSGYMGDPNYIVGRDEIANAIYTAEQRISAFLGFWPAPQWMTSEQHDVPQVPAVNQLPWIYTNQGYLIAAGQEEWELIQSGVTVTYSDPDGDTVDEWASINFATTVTDGLELAVVPNGRDPEVREWRIRPLRTDISAGTATMEGWAWLFTDPDLFLGVVAGELGAVANRLATVDVYRHYNKTYPTQAEYQWLPDTLACTGATATCTPVCQTACVVVGEGRTGQFYARPATWSGGAWNRANWAGTGQPSSLKIWYYAGYRDPLAQPGDVMGENLKQAIVRLANCYLPEAPCGCDFTQQRWSQDRELNAERTMTHDIAQTQMHFGTTMAGAIFARGVCTSIPPLGRGG